MIWLTEKDIYKIIESSSALTDFSSYTNDRKIFKQPKINNLGNAPDYLVFGYNLNNQPMITIFEVKVTATIEVLAQVYKYKSDVMRLCHENGLFISYLDIHICVIARWYDFSLHKILDHMSDITWMQIAQKNNEWGVEYIFGEYLGGKPDKKITKSLTKFFGVKNV